ncbi:MAG TPA: L,D-transpeptidase family protein [Solirubrobacteraceae bacterium]
MTRRLAPLIILGVLALAPAAASAQDPQPAPTTPQTTPAPAPAPVPAPPAATMRLQLVHVGSGGVLAGRRWVVRGTVRPYVAGQQASVRFYRSGRKIAVKGVAIQPRSGAGHFQLGFTSSTPGRITVRASHRATAQLGSAVAKAVRVNVLPLAASPGARGLAVRVLQAQLTQLGYVVGRRGLYDDRTARAVLAFRKLTGMARTTVAGNDVFRKLAAGGGRFKVRYPGHGRHVEADLTHQVLGLIGAGGHVERIYPLSSGKPSTPTVLGSFRVYSKTPGTNAHGMIYSSYFIRGYAIHGYSEVPVYAASHGCLRVPPPDAVRIYNWVRLGTTVDVFYR